MYFVNINDYNMLQVKPLVLVFSCLDFFSFYNRIILSKERITF